ncbi:MAG TPA: metallophosphoesterase [Polyangiaceae bacterium]|nr:metallophosphoesterase [Polyangiaceae bacterium]
MFWLVSLLLSLALMGVLYVWSTRTFPALRDRRRTVAVVLAALPLGQVLMRWVVVLWHFGSALQTALVVTVMTLAMAAVPIAVLHVAGGLVERAARRRRPAPAPVEGAMSRRQVVEAVGGVAMIGATGSTLAWGALRGRHDYQLVELPVRLAALPRALDGYVIAQISDLHTGHYMGERDLDEGFERVRAAKPDLLVVTGDLVDFDPRFAPMLARKLADLAPRDGVFACLGNHDYYTGASDVLDALRAAGVGALVNQGTVVRPRDGGGFALLGVDDRWGGRYEGPGPRLDEAIAMVPGALPRILLSHQPVTVDRWAGKVALQLSGHTHGGQINPGFRPADFFMSYVAGLYRVGGTSLYVNRGFGTVGPPSRVGAPPEVTRIVLVAA